MHQASTHTLYSTADMLLEDFLNRLAPTNQDWSEPSNLWRVPLWVEGDKVTAYVGDNLRRYYSSENMPGLLKSRLGMIYSAKEHSHLHSIDDLYLSMSMIMFNVTYPETYNEIGWRVSKHFYLVVLPHEALQEMRGE